MAIYHMHAKVHSRSSGASSVAAAAYRAAECLSDQRSGETHDYSRRSGVDAAEILAPDTAPQWTRDREQLWNAVEAAENRKDAQVAREVEVALPVELSKQQQRQLVRGFVQREFVGRGMVADVAYHDGKGENPHGHVLLTTRTLGPDGFGKKQRDWNSKELLASWREAWAQEANRALQGAGKGERIDHRSLEVQREEAIARGERQRAEQLDRDPEIHLGKAAWMALRSGRGNERTRRNDRIAFGNVAREQRREEGHAMIRAIQDRIEGLREAVRRVIDRVRGPDRGGDWSR